MGIKKKHVPGCSCCGGTGCCLGNIPSTLTVAYSGQTSTLAAAGCSSVCGTPIYPELQCTQLEGTWVLSKIGAADVCTWNLDTTDGVSYDCATGSQYPSTGNLDVLDITLAIDYGGPAGARRAVLQFSLQCTGGFGESVALLRIEKLLPSLACESFGLTFNHDTDETWTGDCYVDTMATATVTA